MADLKCQICKYYGHNDCQRRSGLAGSHIKQDGRNAGLNTKGYPIVKPDHWCGFFEPGDAISRKYAMAGTAGV